MANLKQKYPIEQFAIIIPHYDQSNMTFDNSKSTVSLLRKKSPLSRKKVYHVYKIHDASLSVEILDFTQKILRNLLLFREF